MSTSIIGNCLLQEAARVQTKLLLSEAAKYREKGMTDDFREVSHILKMGKGVMSTNDAKYFLRFSEINKLGINPNYSYNTPRGIYFYPVTQKVAEEIASGEHDHYGNNSELSSFGINQPYMVFAKLKSGAKVLYVTTYSKADLQADIAKLKNMHIKELSDTDEEQLEVEKRLDLYRRQVKIIPNRKAGELLVANLFSFMTNLSFIGQLGSSVGWLTGWHKHLYKFSDGDITLDQFKDYMLGEINQLSEKIKTVITSSGKLDKFIRDGIKGSKYPDPGTQMWNILRLISRGDEKAWGSLFRRLGYSGVVDEGTGTIHPSEPYQAVFFDISGLEFAGSYENVFQRAEAHTKHIKRMGVRTPGLTIHHADIKAGIQEIERLRKKFEDMHFESIFDLTRTQETLIYNMQQTVMALREKLKNISMYFNDLVHSLDINWIEAMNGNMSSEWIVGAIFSAFDGVIGDLKIFTGANISAAKRAHIHDQIQKHSRYANIKKTAKTYLSPHKQEESIMQDNKLVQYLIEQYLSQEPLEEVGLLVPAAIGYRVLKHGPKQLRKDYEGAKKLAKAIKAGVESGKDVYNKKDKKKKNNTNDDHDPLGNE